MKCPSEMIQKHMWVLVFFVNIDEGKNKLAEIKKQHGFSIPQT